MFTYEKNGLELNMEQMCDICYYYRRYRIAEYLMENYPNKANTEEKALQFAFDIRHKMDKYGYEEPEAIDEVLGEM